jgi:hypothetical protein
VPESTELATVHTKLQYYEILGRLNLALPFNGPQNTDGARERIGFRLTHTTMQSVEGGFDVVLCT